MLALGLCFDELDTVLTPDRVLEVLGHRYEFDLARTCPTRRRRRHRATCPLIGMCERFGAGSLLGFLVVGVR